MKKLPGRRTKFDRPYTQRNSVEWVQSGKEFFDRLEEVIDSAQREIHFQTYIFASDSTGRRIANALIRAAERKAEVFLLVDGFGSQNMAADMTHSLLKAGIHFKKYGELYSRGSFHIGRRMHHKVTVIDGEISVVGGINISDNYNDTPGAKAWLDFAVIMSGDISRRLQFVCRRRWIGIQFSYKARIKLLSDAGIGDKEKHGGSRIRIRRNDFIRNKYEVTISYREALRRSEKSILLVGGYFLPGGRTRRLMKKAIKRGVEINVIVAEKSDVGILVNARRYLYNWLLRNKIGVYEYKLSNVHGKVLIADDRWMSIGSYDLNNLSSYSNIELNVDIDDEKFSDNFGKHIRQIMVDDCQQITTDNPYRRTNIFSKFYMWASYRAVKTFFGLSAILAGKKEKEF